MVIDLFHPDVAYRYQPWADPVTGVDAVADSWLESPDAPDTWEAAYTPYAVEGDKVVATGYSRYLATPEEPERLYNNCFLMEFDSDGRCRSFTEFYMKVR